MRPKNFKASLVGAKKRINGMEWELYLQRGARREGIIVTPIPLGCKRIGPKKLMQVKTPFDFVLTRQGFSAFIDCKSYEDKDRIKYSDLTFHQVDHLNWLETDGESKAGYLIWFRKIDLVCFAKASKLWALKSGESLHADKMEILGNIENFCLSRLFFPSTMEGKNE